MRSSLLCDHTAPPRRRKSIGEQRIQHEIAHGGIEPSAADIDIGRRQLRGEITGDEAVERALGAALNERNERKRLLPSPGHC